MHDTTAENHKDSSEIITLLQGLTKIRLVQIERILTSMSLPQILNLRSLRRTKSGINPDLSPEEYLDLELPPLPPLLLQWELEPFSRTVRL